MQRYVVLAIAMLFVFTGSVVAIDVNILFLGGNTVNKSVEFDTIVGAAKEADPFVFNYTLTNDKKLPEADPAEFDILHLGQGEVCEGGWIFDDDGVEAILAFAKGAES